MMPPLLLALLACTRDAPFVALALPDEPLFIERGAGSLGYDAEGALWVQSGSRVVRFVDGKPTDTVRGRLLLADLEGPVVMTSGGDLSIYDTSPPRKVALDIHPFKAIRTPDGGFALGNRELVVRFDWSGVEQARAPHGCNNGGGALRVIGDDIWATCDYVDARRWTSDGFVQEPYPGLDSPWLLGDDGRVRDRDSGQALAILPGRAGLVVHADAQLIARVQQNPWRRLVWADLTTGDVRPIDHRGTQFHETALAPDRRTLAVANGHVVDFFDMKQGAWLTDSVLHRQRAEVQAVSDDGQRALTADSTGVRILWHRDGAPVVLPPPTWPLRKPDERTGRVRSGRGEPYYAAFSDDDARLVSTFDGGAFTVHDGRSGATLWQGDASPDALDGPSHNFHVVRVSRGPSCMTGEKWPVSRPFFSPDGAHVAAGGSHDGNSLIQVWDAASGEVVQRYRFTSVPLIQGFRKDGRMVVLAGDSLFALHAGRGEIEPEFINSNVANAWVRDGEVEWRELRSDQWRAAGAPHYKPDPRVVLEEGRAVFR